MLDLRLRPRLADAATRLAVKAGLVGGSLASGSLFWVRATLGQNQLTMHDCTKDGAISIGGVSEQLYGEGFVAAFHEVLGREVGPRLPQVLYEIGVRGAQWEVNQAIQKGVWVPTLLRGLVGKPALLKKVRTSAFTHALMKESLRVLFRMIMTEGGWGAVEEIDLRSDPVKLTVANTPEPRRLGKTGQCSCHLMTGIYAGYFGTILGTPATAKETACVSRGDPRCTFEVTLVEKTPETPAAPAKKQEPVAAARA